jgi:endonuclease YncB( thermonuclease family)
MDEVSDQMKLLPPGWKIGRIRGVRPMPPPPHGIYSPCNLKYFRDADTPVVLLPSFTFDVPLRLIDCWASEERHVLGRRATEFARAAVAGKALGVWIPLPENVAKLLAGLSFDRVPAWLYLGDDDTLNERLVAAGHAYATKPEQLDAERRWKEGTHE